MNLGWKWFKLGIKQVRCTNTVVINSPRRAFPARQESNASSLCIPSRPRKEWQTRLRIWRSRREEMDWPRSIIQHGEAVITEERSREVLKEGNQNKKKKSDPSRQRLSVACGSLRELLELLPSSITNAKAGLESTSRSVQLLGPGPVSFPTTTPRLSNSTNTDSV